MLFSAVRSSCPPQTQVKLRSGWCLPPKPEASLTLHVKNKTELLEKHCHVFWDPAGSKTRDPCCATSVRGSQLPTPTEPVDQLKQQHTKKQTTKPILPTMAVGFSFLIFLLGLVHCNICQLLRNTWHMMPNIPTEPLHLPAPWLECVLLVHCNMCQKLLNN